MSVKKMSFVACMKDYFGLRSGQTSVEFMQEIKSLQGPDREFFKTHLPTVGYEIIPAAA